MDRRSFVRAMAAAPALASRPPLPKLADAWKEDPVRVGLRKQLLVDDYVVSTRFNLTRELGRPEKANGGRPVMTALAPRENANFGFGGWLSVLHVEGKFGMWYSSRYSEEEGYITAYAESSDGIHFTRPAVGRNGTNEVFVHSGGFICSLDPHETDPAHRFKAAYGGRQIMACLAHSPDGIHWTPYNDGKPVTGRASDTLNLIIWDEDAGLYRLFTRSDFGTTGGDQEYRGMRMMTNRDVKSNPGNWTTVRSWLFDREGPGEVRRRQIQGMGDWIHHGVHFALMSVHEWPLGETDFTKSTPGRDLVRRHERDVVNYYLATSRDGDNWDLGWIYAQKPFIARGPDGSFDKDMIFASSSASTWQGRHWFYYSGSAERHWVFPRPSAIGLATLREDGMIFVEPWQKEEPAWFITKPFRVDGRFLEVNADARGGQLTASLLDADANPISGFDSADAVPMTGDSLKARLRWQENADLAPLMGRVVRIRFELRRTSMYAFQIVA